jgi:hypothetical protein
MEGHMNCNATVYTIHYYCMNFYYIECNKNMITINQLYGLFNVLLNDQKNTIQNKQNKCDYIWISSQNGPIFANATFVAYYIYLSLMSLKIPKGQSESVNRRTDNTMV